KRGLRIDFILASQALSSRVDSAWIDREERKGKGASDHAPVVIEIS
ncbi:MAG: exodeoxyribonuclease III, partial [Flavobacterium sp.]|nr:exodeoxyribonuclease III [Aeromicrobium sp.]